MDLEVGLTTPEEILDLRWVVLREGRPRWTANMKGDELPTSRHWAARMGGQVVGCVSVMYAPAPDGQGTQQLRGMAVHPAFQRQGVGAAMLQVAHETYGNTLWCNARSHAVPFYASNGWRVVSEEFTIPRVGPHLRMVYDANECLHRGEHLSLMRRGGWEFVRRTTATGIVCVVAKTQRGEVVLVEQHRPPVDARVIELPAGLAGDLAGASNEEMLEAAKRELLEETGYQAKRWRHAMSSPVSAGLTDAILHVFVADGLQQKGPGGGDGSEAIVVHHVPINELGGWLASQQAEGKLVDVKVWLASVV